MQTDPIGYDDGMNWYAYVGNDPVNATDPTGMYGRGKGWSDENWKKFDAAQNKAALAMSKSASSMRNNARSMKDGETNSDGYSAKELTSMAGSLEAGAAALNDNGTGGYMANSVDSLPHDRFAQAPIGGNDVSVNVKHDAFGKSNNPFLLGHESLHSAGLKDYTQGKFPAYRYGSKDSLRAYNYLSNYQKGKRYLNPDHVMSQVYP